MTAFWIVVGVVGYALVGSAIVRRAAGTKPLPKVRDWPDWQTRSFAVALWPLIVAFILFYVIAYGIGRLAGGK